MDYSFACCTCCLLKREGNTFLVSFMCQTLCLGHTKIGICCGFFGQFLVLLSTGLLLV